MKRIIFISVLVFLISLLDGSHYDLSAKVLEQDSLALVALYDSTKGANWTNKTNWLSGSVDTWYGIVVSENRVVAITLDQNNLTGHLPPALGYLTQLDYFSVYGNQLTGAIPRELGNLTKLISLRLEMNQLTGEIPSEIGNLVNLQEFSLYDNQLTGLIPPEIFNLTRLTYLNFHSNLLTGDIPPAIGNLINLTHLGLYHNQLTGTIPNEIGLLTQLVELTLGQNQLSGSIPVQIGNLTNLEKLQMDLNQFSGTIPAQIWELSSLTTLFLDNNQLTGAIPPRIGNLMQLERLNLAANQFGDTLPATLGNLTKLERLYLFKNKFTGAVPAGVGQMPLLERLYLDENQFTDLPDLSADTSLIYSRIGDNNFTFEDIEPNMFITNFSYSPQDSVGEKQDTTIESGASLTLSVAVGGTANHYQWQKNSTDIPGANGSSYAIGSATAADSGAYCCKITNSIVANLTLYSRTIHVTIAGGVGIVDDENDPPRVFALQQNYPNPFNPTTTINYTIPQAALVNIAIYNMLGQQVKVIENKLQPPGLHSAYWNGEDSNGNFLSSGLYLCRIDAGAYRQSIKLMLVR
ncbi:MAG: leucine-rich repeat domain-containing protein [Candidatus Zhuqueibacterota bacterium]